MRHFGIIGYPLQHSFSANYFTDFFAREHIDAEYSLYPIPTEKLSRIGELVNKLDGMNVTMPYKQTVIPYLNCLDATAKAVGAVNVVHNHIGYNTDCLGFIASLQPLLRPHDRQALIFGTGGAAKAVVYGLKQLGVASTLVSRTPKICQLSYSQLDETLLKSHTILINCTPLGMYPNVNDCPPIPYELITSQHLLFDCVYNPKETLFLRRGKEKGAIIRNGIEMLYGQAKAAWEIWSNKN